VKKMGYFGSDFKHFIDFSNMLKYFSVNSYMAVFSQKMSHRQKTTVANAYTS